jgi:hypothetical protein
MSARPTLIRLGLRNAGVALVVCLAVATFSAGSAFALEPGVTINPTSPAGQQYAYPLSVLRGQGAGDPTPGAGSAVPLFGVGVTPATGKTPSAHVGRRRAHAGAGAGVGHRAHRADAGVTASDGAGTRKVNRRSALGAARLENPRPSRVPVVVAAVLALGVVLGLGLRAP